MWCGSKGEPTTSPQSPAATASTAGGKRQGAPSASDPGSDVGPVEPLPIKGLHWLDHDALAVVAHQGLSTLLLVLDSGLYVREQVEWMDQPLPAHGAGGGVGGSCANSIVGLGPRLYLLGGLGLMCGRLLPWSERLKTLQDIQKFKLGLFLALEFYKVMQQRLKQQGSGGAGAGGVGEGGSNSNSSSRGTSFSGPTGMTSGSSFMGSAGTAAGGAAAGAGAVTGSGIGRPKAVSLGGMARSEGWGAEPQQLEQWMLSLMLGYVHTAMQELTASYTKASSSSSSNSPVAVAGVVSEAAGKELHHVAAIAVSCCLLLLRPSVLFDRVFVMFDRGPGALRVAAVGALVEALEPAVLADLLEGVSPEVMQVGAHIEKGL